MPLTGHLDREDHVDLPYESSPDRLVPKLHVRVVQSHLIPSLPLLHRELPLHIGVLLTKHLPTSLNTKVSLLPPLVDVVTRLFSEQLLPQKEEKEKQEED